VFDTLGRVGTWHDPELGRPIAAPLEQCAELLDIDLATVRDLATNVEPYLRADGTRIWSLTQLVTRQATFALLTISRNRRSWALRFRQAM
jgi:hypothetical protein